MRYLNGSKTIPGSFSTLPKRVVTQEADVGLVVDDHMHRFLLGHPGIDNVEEADELLMAMALHTLADDLAV